jgi:hypothetical protein
MKKLFKEGGFIVYKNGSIDLMYLDVQPFLYTKDLDNSVYVLEDSQNALAIKFNEIGEINDGVFSSELEFETYLQELIEVTNYSNQNVGLGNIDLISVGENILIDSKSSDDLELLLKYKLGEDNIKYTNFPNTSTPIAINNIDSDVINSTFDLERHNITFDVLTVDSVLLESIIINLNSSISNLNIKIYHISESLQEGYYQISNSFYLSDSLYFNLHTSTNINNSGGEDFGTGLNTVNVNTIFQKDSYYRIEISGDSSFSLLGSTEYISVLDGSTVDFPSLTFNQKVKVEKTLITSDDRYNGFDAYTTSNTAVDETIIVALNSPIDMVLTNSNPALTSDIYLPNGLSGLYDYTNNRIDFSQGNVDEYDSFTLDLRYDFNQDTDNTTLTITLEFTDNVGGTFTKTINKEFTNGAGIDIEEVSRIAFFTGPSLVNGTCRILLSTDGDATFRIKTLTIFANS